MTFEAMLKHWKTIEAICKAFGTTHQTAYNWRKARLVPKGIACEAHIRSKYKIPIDLKMYD